MVAALQIITIINLLTVTHREKDGSASSPFTQLDVLIIGRFFQEECLVRKQEGIATILELIHPSIKMGKTFVK